MLPVQLHDARIKTELHKACEASLGVAKINLFFVFG